MSRWVLLSMLIGYCLPVIAEVSIESFKSGSYTKILNMHQGRPFVLVFWSLECVPCHKELVMLGTLKPRQFELVLVATDRAITDEEIRNILTKYQLQNIDSWKFNDTLAERLRYEVDTTWYGELPRSYLFDSQHRRQAISGLLSRQIIDAWTQGD